MGPIIITLPYIFAGETRLVSALSRRTGGYIHLRKPDETRERTEEWIKELLAAGADPDRLTLHHYPELAVKYSLGGVHFGYGNFVGVLDMLPPVSRLSVSCHSWEEARQVAEDVDYLFISPVFDSISKPGYMGSAELSAAYEIGEAVASKTVALGGVTAGNLRAVRDAGFGGAAALGSVWKFADDGSPDTEATADYYAELQKEWKLAACGFQSVSDGDMDKAWAFLEGGGRWIQLRMKDAGRDEVASRGKALAELCSRYDAVFIVDDDPLAAAACGADGVHLGREDMPPAGARELLGPDKIIGATANTIEDIAALGSMPVDYIGLGPYRFTATKKRLSPVLGIEGYRAVMAGMRERGIDIPVVAIGGILPGDVRGIMDTGVTGVAVSGAISNAADAQRESRAFINELRERGKL